MSEKLGQEPAFANSNHNAKHSDGTPNGMSKRFYAANNAIKTADKILRTCPIQFISEFIGTNFSDYKSYVHYPMALAKMAYIIANELLKQEQI